MFASQEGKHVPHVTFHTRQGDQWVDLSSEQLFKNKTVIVFSLPGAFTPTCSSSHLPRYNELAPVFKNHGVDSILCVSVNDTFVMNAWKAEQNASNITFIPDGNGEFTKGMDMLVEKADLGFGPRSWRYSMLVRDGVVEKMFVEPNKPGDPFEVSDAATMLAYINPKARKPDQVAILTRDGCTYCAQAKALLDDRGIDYVEIPLTHKVRNKALGAIAGAQSVPQIFINGQRIGGYEELKRWAARAA